MINLKSKHKLLVVLISTAFLLFFLTGTNPNELSAIYLLVPPILVFVALYYLVNFILSSFIKNSTRVNMISLVFAAGPMAILFIASMGQLTSRDTILTLCLMFGLSFYVYRARIKPE